MTRADHIRSPRRFATAAVLAAAVAVGLVAVSPAEATAAVPAPAPAQNPPPSTDPQPDPAPAPTQNPQPTQSPQPTQDPQPTAPPAAPPTTPPTGATTPPAPVPDPAAEAAAAAAELARERAREAAERAADLAAAQARTAETWTSRGRPERMIVVRDLSIETVSGGKLTAQVPRPAGTLTLGGLDRLVPDSWVTVADEDARLTAVVVLTPGTSLDLSGVKTLRLQGGPDLRDAASIYTGSGEVSFADQTVVSVDPETDEPMPAGPGRPFIVVANGGRLDARDSVFSDLGTPLSDAANRTGLQFNDGATGSLVRTTARGNTVGIRLAGSQGVRLEEVLAEESVAEGIVLSGDRGTTLRGVRAERNGADGVILKGENAAGRVISGIATNGNGGYGLSVVGQDAPRIRDVTTQADKTGGLRINRSTEVEVTGFTATDQPIGIFTHVGASDLTLQGVTITGGRRGVVVEKSTSRLALRDSTIDGTSVVGIGLGGKHLQLDAVSVSGARTGVKVERGAQDVVATGLALAGGEDGFVANPGSAGVVIRDLVAEGVGNDAVRTYSPATQITGGRVSGADTGVVASAATTIEGTAITEVTTGLRARGPEAIAATRIDVAALSLGIDAAPGTPMSLTDSKVQALEALRGAVQLVGVNQISLPPLNLLGAIGVPLVLLAVVLELVHWLRVRRYRRPRQGRAAPPLAAAAGAS